VVRVEGLKTANRRYNCETSVKMDNHIKEYMCVNKAGNVRVT
jgi:hypothetical protein